MRPLNVFALFCAGLVLVAASRTASYAANAAAATQSTGSISGRVQNLATAAYLEGAIVTLEPSRQSTLTARDGSFYFSSLPAGDYRLSVSYTGLDNQTITLTI